MLILGIITGSFVLGGGLALASSFLDGRAHF